MPKVSVTLPLEILDLIVGFLSEDGDTSSVKALALSCGYFLPACRARLYFKVILVPRHIHGQDCKTSLRTFQRKLERLQEVFDSNSTLPNYVRNLTLMFIGGDHDNLDIHNLLDRFKHVKTLSFQGTHADVSVYSASADWFSLSPNMQKAIWRLMKLPSLDHLCFNQIVNFPLGTLVHNKNLTHLTIESSDFQEGINSTCNNTAPWHLVDDTAVLRLRSLTFTDYSSSVVKTLIDAKHPKNGRPLVDLSELSVLNSLDKTGDVVVPQLIENSYTLTSLSCTVWDTFNNPFRDLVKSHTLRTLKIFKPVIVIPPWLGDIHIDPYYSLIEEFRQWAGRNILERIEITINVEQNAKIPIASDTWSTLNGLAFEGNFPRLHTVTLTINLQDTTPWARQFKWTLENHQEDLFPDLIRRKGLHFQMIISHSSESHHTFEVSSSMRM